MSSPPGQFLGVVTHRHSSPAWIVTDLWHARPNQFPAHSHRWTCLTVLLGGSYAECVEGRWHERPVNSLIIRPAMAPHADRVGRAGARFLNVEVSAELIPSRSDAARPLAEWTVERSTALASIGWSMLRELRSGEPDSSVMDGYVASLIAELTCGPASRHPPGWLARALQMIHDGYAGHVGIDALVRECGVHPAHLTRVFRRHVGQTVGTYVRALRLSAAMERLADPRTTIARAGHEAGFHDESHLSRTLRAVTSLTPGRYRRLVTPDRN